MNTRTFNENNQGAATQSNSDIAERSVSLRLETFKGVGNGYNADCSVLILAIEICLRFVIIIV